MSAPIPAFPASSATPTSSSRFFSTWSPTPNKPSAKFASPAASRFAPAAPATASALRLRMTVSASAPNRYRASLIPSPPPSARAAAPAWDSVSACPLFANMAGSSKLKRSPRAARRSPFSFRPRLRSSRYPPLHPRPLLLGLRLFPRSFLGNSRSPKRSGLGWSGGYRLLRRRGRKENGEGRAARGERFSFDDPAMFANNGHADTESQAGAAARALGGVEGIKEAR